MIVLGKLNSKHLYNIGSCSTNGLITIQVHANNRDQAARIVERAGYIVRDVNMVG